MYQIWLPDGAYMASSFSPREGSGLYLKMFDMMSTRSSFSPREGSGLYPQYQGWCECEAKVSAPVRGAGCIGFENLLCKGGSHVSAPVRGAGCIALL